MRSTERGSVLVVEDEDAVREYLQSTLRGAGFDVSATRSGETALEKLRQTPPGIDLVVLDLAMPHMDGFELLSRIRSSATTMEIPALIVSGFRDISSRVAGLRIGANDFLTKPVDAKELVARVETHLRVANAARVWRERARTDPLTGLLNRQGFTECVEREVERALRHRRPLALAFFDLDGFKAVNDMLGHRAGDDLLCAVARALEGAARGCDVVGRWGGDEFVAVFPDAERADALSAVHRIQERVSTLGRAALPLGLSAGVACLDHGAPGDRERRAEMLIDEADREMYRDKVARMRHAFAARVIAGGG